MKKTYQQPITITLKINEMDFICTSNEEQVRTLQTNTDLELEDGSNTSARARESIWDEEW